MIMMSIEVMAMVVMLIINYVNANGNEWKALYLLLTIPTTASSTMQTHRSIYSHTAHYTIYDTYIPHVLMYMFVNENINFHLPGAEDLF